MEMKPYTISLDPKTNLEFKTSEKVFYPTGTTSLLIDSLKKHIQKPGRVLDLGCGTGIVGVMMSRLGLATAPLYLSDLSEDAVNLATKNCNAHGVDVVAKAGSLFAPWKGEAFDYIVDDVSGVAEAIGNVSIWFSGASCQSGKDGTDLVLQVIREAREYLLKDGKLFFPVLSLSNQEKILSEAGKSFQIVERIGRMEWPLPPDLVPHLPMMRKMREEGDIKFSEKFGMVIWTTEIFMASN